MKKVKLIALAYLVLTTFASNAQNNSMKEIETTITEFAKAADNSDAEKLGTYLDDNYRIVMNRLFGSNEVSVLTKDLYLSKIESKEFGGDKREGSIESITINGSTANAKVRMIGTKMTFVSLLSLVQDAAGNWKLISDTPITE
ncbi:MAG: nuclear transport factor 2 family protein [Crocinitomicaceae bacterium]|nr:nuclear transport factor 2 family protein [Crocinitomicaceae bacterium]